MRFEFGASEPSTIGIEWELALVDPGTLELVPAAQRILDAVDDPKGGPIRREFLTDMIELVTGVHRRVDEAIGDLAGSLARLRGILGDDVALIGAGTHPFSRSDDQQHFDFWRYNTVAEQNAWWGRRMVVFGTHLHVGVDHRDKALPITYGLARFSPYFIALSAGSPFWEGEDTGFASQRIMLFQQLPTNGLPYHVEDWAQFEAYADELESVGMARTPSEIRWDVRPSAFGTVENRVLDSVPTLAELGALTALGQCLAEWMNRELEAGREIGWLPVWFVRENKWRACRYGLDAEIITPSPARRVRSLRDGLTDWLNRLEPIAADLGCGDELAFCDTLARRGPAYVRQRAAFAATGDLREVVRLLTDETGAAHPRWAD